MGITGGAGHCQQLVFPGCKVTGLLLLCRRSGGTQVHGPLSNSYYDYDKVLINGEKVITAGALFSGGL